MHPPGQRFSKTDLAKYEHAWLGLPHLVCLGAEKNFTKFAARLDEDGSPLVDQVFFQDVVARALIWKLCERAFSQQGLVGHRANSVAYGFSLVAERTQRKIDLSAIWKAQEVPASLADLLAKAVQLAHAFLTSQPGNIGEASKKPATWAKFKETDLALPSSLVKKLVKEAPSAYAPSAVRKPEHEDAIIAVERFGAEYWFGLAKWAKERNLLLPWQRSLAFSLGRLAGQRTRPSPKQAAQGLIIVERATELGYFPGAT
jgi:hypothetical protein